jgi:hypothetical protein
VDTQEGVSEVDDCMGEHVGAEEPKGKESAEEGTIQTDPALEAKMVEEGLQAIQVLERMGLVKEREFLQHMQEDLRRHRDDLCKATVYQETSAAEGKTSTKPLDVQLRKVRGRLQRLVAAKKRLQADELQLQEVLEEVNHQLCTLGERLSSIDDDIEEAHKLEKGLAWDLAKETGALGGSSDSDMDEEDASADGESDAEGDQARRRRKRKGYPGQAAEEAPACRSMPGLAEEMLRGLRADATPEATKLHEALNGFIARAGLKVDPGQANHDRGGGKGVVGDAGDEPRGLSSATPNAAALATNLLVLLGTEVENGNEYGAPLLEALRLYQQQIQEAQAQALARTSAAAGAAAPAQAGGHNDDKHESRKIRVGPY